MMLYRSGQDSGVGKLLPSIDADRCGGCERCVVGCPRECLELIDGIAVLRRAKACLGEGLCVSACGERAIRLEWREPGRRRIAKTM